MKKIPRALVLLSGGLDSILAVKALKIQGIKITALSFKSYFFNTKLAEKASKMLGVNLRVVDFSKLHLAMLKNPKHGYGKSMNPCIDCHALMLKKAKEIMEKEKFDFVATGEVLGERPMSQTSRAMKIIEKETSLTGFLLRPLSAKLLKPTIPENEGLVDRSRLFDISGRSRKKQVALARLWHIKDYPLPAGGCLLTDSIFGGKLRELLKICSKCDGTDIDLLKIGRHFIFGKTKIVIGRNEEENKKIKTLARRGDILIEMKKYSGPQTIIKNYLPAGRQVQKKEIPAKILIKAKELTKYYSTKTRDLTEDIKFNIIKHLKN